MGAQSASNQLKSVFTVGANVAALYDKATAWDYTLIKRYAVEKGIYSASEIDRVVDEYCRFLALSVACPSVPIPISEKVDKFWHTHILFTENYSDMSDMLAGGYLHHRPAILDPELHLKEAFESETLRLYRENFGEPDKTYWDQTCCKRCTCHTVRQIQ
jgi:hypothetical protein